MWRSTIFYCLLVVPFLEYAIGEPQPYKQYRIVYSGSSPSYTYYSNPYVNSYTSGDNIVYVTDQYGRTSAQSGVRYGRGRSLSYTAAPPGTVQAVNAPGYSSTTCTATTCGQNAQCSVIGGVPVCSCLRSHLGDPLGYCTRAECLDDTECRGHLTCINQKCVDPCAGSCGDNAYCEARNHLPVCTCPAGYTGNPVSHCRRFDPEELCHPSPCGPNTQCTVKNEVPSCSCLPGYHGSPLTGCRHECDSDAECGPGLACLEFKCKNPCLTQCGTNADCEGVSNHRAVCKCPKNYFGNPYVSCQPECYGDVDCPPGKPACYYGICKSPCDGACGEGANCELRGLTPVCSCPKDMTGHPFVKCRPFVPEDLCEPNPCGTNADCNPGFDRYGKERPVCTCPAGFTGDPLRHCQQGECTDDSQCPDSKACINYSCQNPCISKCGSNAECTPRRHIAVCTCPAGYNGDALIQCYPIEIQDVPSHRSRLVCRNC